MLVLTCATRIIADSQVSRVDEQQFLDDLDNMSPKELKKFVRANGVPSVQPLSRRRTCCCTATRLAGLILGLPYAGMDCVGCKKKQWLATAREVVQKSEGRAGWGGGDYATAPDGGMQMSREEFQQQLVCPPKPVLGCLPTTACCWLSIDIDVGM